MLQVTRIEGYGIRLAGRLFEEVNRQLSEKGLFVRKGTIVDVTMVESTNRPMKKEKQQS